MRGRVFLMMYWILRFYVKFDYILRKYLIGDIYCLLLLIIEVDCFVDNLVYYKVYRLIVLLLDLGRNELSYGIMFGYRLIKINKFFLILYLDYLFVLFFVFFIFW